MSMTLTKRQGECLAIIQARITQTGMAPSFNEIATGLGIRSKSGVYRIVSALERRGRIRRLPNMARAIEVLQPEAANDRGHNVRLNPEITRIVVKYAAEQRIGVDTAVNALLRTLLDADA